MTLPVSIQACMAGLQRPALGGCRLPAAVQKALKSSSEGEKGSTFLKDTLSIAEPLRALSESGLDLEKSRFVQSSQLLSFDLTYQESSIQQLSLQGYYDFHSQLLTADFSFVSALAIKDPETGQERQELFRFSFHLEAQHAVCRSGSSGEQKEDILLFARKLVTKIARLYSEGKEIDGLALDSEDLKELGAVNDGRLLKSIMAIIDVMRTISLLRKREGEHVWVSLDREKSMVSTKSEQEQENLDFSLKVERVVQESGSQPVPVEALSEG